MESSTDTNTEKLSKDINRNLVTDFFIYFARFEYALKRAGYVKGDEKKAEVNWDVFANDLAASFQQNSSSELQEAVKYFQSSPPKKQVVQAGQLSWKEPRQGDGETLIAWLLRLVRAVRNNLFHGGKFPTPIGPMAETARDQKLLSSSLTVLAHCLQLNKEVHRYFADES